MFSGICQGEFSSDHSNIHDAMKEGTARAGLAQAQIRNDAFPYPLKDRAGRASFFNSPDAVNCVRSTFFLTQVEHDVTWKAQCGNEGDGQVQDSALISQPLFSYMAGLHSDPCLKLRIAGHDNAEGSEKVHDEPRTVSSPRPLSPAVRVVKHLKCLAANILLSIWKKAAVDVLVPGDVTFSKRKATVSLPKRDLDHIALT